MNTAICQDKIKKARDIKHMTKQEAIQECLKEVKNELAAKVLVDKYFLCDGKEYHETQPQQMWNRLAKANALAEEETKREQYEQEFKRILDDFKFVPGGRILYGLGNKMVNTTLKNCYVIAIQEDSIKGMHIVNYAQKLLKEGKYEKIFSAYVKKGIKAEDLPKYFEETKKKIG